MLEVFAGVKQLHKSESIADDALIFREAVGLIFLSSPIRPPIAEQLPLQTKVFSLTVR